MNKFEVVLLLNPELSTQNLKTEISKFKDHISNNDGKIINEENWGLRDLNYNIKKFKKAFYNYIQIEISGHLLDKIKKDLNQTDNLLRYLFIKVSEHQELPTKLKYEKK
tara:strand:- start:2529 stop:2855 length:327 start_codon:yes stop_codon:yes gene_type:complete